MGKSQTHTKKSILHLQTADPILGQVIAKITLASRKPNRDYFYVLAREIMRQQLSGASADAIENRFCALFGSGGFPLPKKILAMPDEKIRSAGLSYPKVKYIKCLAKAVLDNTLDLDRISACSDEKVIVSLTQVKGIGRWTAEMFLMFALNRPDVFSYGDQGLKNAMRRLYKMRNHPTQKRAAQISNRWKPHRTLACRYLWASLKLKDDPKLI
ncbi:MAG: DNA-3-methyladenine glycosylase II [Parcubacteria group bacterium Gr01-1014_33]|nr:MAG: DNA-3-methyladenine glycosylase II [Parcubacteria group bacterium Gr01-1014_33]